MLISFYGCSNSRSVSAKLHKLAPITARVTEPVSGALTAEENPAAVPSNPAGLPRVLKEKPSLWTRLPLWVSQLGFLALSWRETGGRRVKGTWPCSSSSGWANCGCEEEEVSALYEFICSPSSLTWHSSFESVLPVDEVSPGSSLMVSQDKFEIKSLINLWKLKVCAGKKAEKQTADWASIRFRRCTVCCFINVPESETFSPSVPMKCILRAFYFSEINASWLYNNHAA